MKLTTRSKIAVVIVFTLLISGCFGGSKPPASEPRSSGTAPVTGGGGFFGGDRPPGKVPDNIDSIPDAVPEPLPLSKTGNKPYVAMGKRYKPMASSKGYRTTGTASWYGKKFHGRRTSSGEPYDMFAMTAAHPVLPIPSFARVTSLDNGRSVVVKVNDRGPFLHGRVIDLSYAAAHRLGITATGTGRVEVVALDSSAGVQPSKAQVVVTQPAATQYSGTAGDGINHGKSVAIEPATNPPTVASSGTYLLQIGVFSDLVNALTLRRQLRRQGLRLSPPTDRSLAAGDAPYRVVVGPYTDRNQAEQVRRKLSRETGQPVRLIDG